MEHPREHAQGTCSCDIWSPQPTAASSPEPAPSRPKKQNAPSIIGDPLTTQNLIHRTTGRAAASPLAVPYTTAGSYTDTDTLTKGTRRITGRPRGYAATDTLTRAKTDAAVRPGSYTDIDALCGGAPGLGRPGSYTDTAHHDR